MAQETAPSVGNIIVPHGASSSGKSIIAWALQACLPLPFWHISIGHLRDAGVLPLERIRRGEFSWTEMRDPFLRGFERFLAVYAEAGNHLVVEYIIETLDGVQRLATMLGRCDVFLVGVHCPSPELERRERARGDRPFGDARRDFFTVQGHDEYDFDIDATRPPEWNADLIAEAWTRRSGPGVLARRARQD